MALERWRSAADCDGAACGVNVRELYSTLLQWAWREEQRIERVFGQTPGDRRACSAPSKSPKQEEKRRRNKRDE